MTLRWKKNKRPTGLAAVGAGPSGSSLRDGDVRYANVSANRVNYQVIGWYWVAGFDSAVPHMNTCGSMVDDEATAKADAMAYVKSHIKAQEAKP